MGSCNKVLRTSHSLKVPYTSRTSYIVPSTEPRFFSGEVGGGGALIQILTSGEALIQSGALI